MTMELKYDPYQIFRGSVSPAGLYARQKWLGESNTPPWNEDFQQTVDVLLSDRWPRLSGYSDAVRTIVRLFGLHLTIRNSTEVIDTILTRLLELVSIDQHALKVSLREDTEGIDLIGLPFTSGYPPLLLFGAILFLSTIFDRGTDPDVLVLYQWLGADGNQNQGLWRDEKSTHNILRATVVHPFYSNSESTAAAIDYLHSVQRNDGSWGASFPFYQTFNALAHTGLPQAARQCHKALVRLVATQNTDGSWGDKQREWHTFLVIHALKNMGALA